MRAFRLDKMTLAALEATLRLYLNEERALREVPNLRMLGLSLSELRQRAENFAVRLRALPGVANVHVNEDIAYVGGGSLPDQALKSCVVEVEAESLSDADLALRLRTGTPAVMGRLQNGRVLLDLRTVFPEQEDELLRAMGQAVRPEQA
jgi:L-seryl-tRNA(Ser) seleniumtransferase